MVRYIPAKRTALDNRVWWCIFDTKTGKYIPAYKWSRKKDAQFYIDFHFGGIC